jgi:hypothetical protein
MLLIKNMGFLAIFFLLVPMEVFSAELEDAPIPPKIEAGKRAEMKRQAGIGSEHAYASAGVVEAGGAVTYSSSESRTTAGLTPSMGYFFADNFQVSALTNFTYTRLKEEATKEGDDVETVGEDTTNSGSVVLEPSAHMPLTRQQFVFGGIGVGAYFAKDQDTGFAVAPRVGLKNLVGRSGMLSVAVQGVYAIDSQENEDVEGTVITVEDGANLAFGYSVLL